MSNSSIYLLMAGVVLLHAGAFLLRISWWPRRTGKDPYCGKCEYLLIGIDSQRCPECGQFLVPRNIRQGQRIRRPGVAAIGVFVFLMGLATTIASCTIQSGR